MKRPFHLAFVFVLLLLGAQAQSPKPRTATPPAQDVLFDVYDDILAGDGGWRLLNDGKSSDVFYDRSRITKPRRDVVRFWAQTINEPPEEQVAKRLSLVELNCADSTMRVLSRVEYDKDGKVLSSISDKNRAWVFIAPDSIGEEMLNVLCKGKKDLESQRRDIASSRYSLGRKAEMEGKYKIALNHFEWAQIMLTQRNAKLEAAIIRVKAKLP